MRTKENFVSKFKAVHNFIESIKDSEEPINVIMHNVPDPDAMGSAIGVQFLLRKLGKDSQIYYGGEISHPQNKTLVNVLDAVLNKTDKDVEGINICVDGTEKNSICDVG